MNKLFFTCGLIIICLLLLSDLHGQGGYPHFRMERSTATFVPPLPRPIPPGWEKEAWEEEVKRQEDYFAEQKAVYEKKAYDLAAKLHKKFRIISSLTIDSLTKQAAKRSALRLFRDQNGEERRNVRYYGLLLNQNFELQPTDLDLRDYIDTLINRFRTTQFSNVCWSLPQIEEDGDLPLDFRPTNESFFVLTPTQPADTTEYFYQKFRATFPVREKTAFFKNGLTHVNDRLCKELIFELRCFLRLDTTGIASDDLEKLFVWKIALVEIREASDKNACNELRDDLDCPSPDRIPEVADDWGPDPDSALLNQPATQADPERQASPALPDSIGRSSYYKPVPAWTYLVPGSGFQHFRERKEKEGFPFWTIITGTWAGLSGAAAFYKIRSDKAYNRHKNASTFRVLDREYDLANNSNRRFLLLAGAAATVWLTTDIIIFLKDRRQIREAEINWGDPVVQGPSADSYSYLQPALLPVPTGGLGIGVSWKFNF